MLEFKEITLADKEWMEPLFRMANLNAEEYNFTFCYIWRKVFRYEAARLGDYLIIRSTKENRPRSYHFPAGSGDLAPVMEALMEAAARDEAPLTFHIALAGQKRLLETLYPGRFVFLPLEDYYDYVYHAESLITLAGKKLHQKRTHINRFKEHYPDWSYEPITPGNLPEVIAMNEEWRELNSEYSDKSMEEESRSVEEAIHDFFALGMDGGLIRAGGRVVAFSMGDRLCSDTYLVHIEKAYGDIQGAYAIINQEFAAHNCEGYLYIDREDDSGEEGLRKAKQSYRPAFQVEKYAAKKIG